MKHYFTLLSHEVRMLLVNPSTYIAATLFLSVMGFMFTGILESYSKTPQDASPAQVFFSVFWFPVLFIVPLLTMKCLAEERRLGTIETLLTTPVEASDRDHRLLERLRDRAPGPTIIYVTIQKTAELLATKLAAYWA